MRPPHPLLLALVWCLLLRAGVFAETRSGLNAAVEVLTCDDVRLFESSAQIRGARPNADFALSLAQSRVAIDYAPALSDIVSRARTRTEERTAPQLTARFTGSRLNGFAGAGGYTGFSDFRSVWLAEYYRQLFTGVPNYTAVSPRGWNALAGARWAYQPTSGFLQGSLRVQHDHVSPGYEPQIFAPLLRGRERLASLAVRLSTENVLSRTVRTLVETGYVSTTGRRARLALQGAVNWAASEAWTLRAVASGVTEHPAFHSETAELTLEHDWDAQWFAGIMVRGYRDSGEVVDPLIPSTAAPARRTQHAAVMLRWRGDRGALRLEAGPYRTRHAALPTASQHFGRLYAGRDWVRLQLSAEWFL